MTREQEHALDQLALTHGRVHVRTGYLDRYVELTVLSGECRRVYENGTVVLVGPDFSVDWAQR